MKHNPRELAVLRSLQTFEAKTVPHAFGRAQVSTLRTLVRSQDPQYWQKAGERKALKLFHAAARRVPAYKDFLAKQRVRLDHIETMHDFKKLPILTKENYIKPYTIKERSWDGVAEAHTILAMSSGTSGVPTVWPRGPHQEAEAAFIHEFLFADLYDIDTHKTLIIICFPMGVYVSGVATALPTVLAAFARSNVSVVTAGNNKDSVLLFLQQADTIYEQIILIGHPFFVKDIIETGVREHMSWTSLRVRTMFCSEGFNETWRTYVASLLGVDAKSTILSTYGSSEFLLTGFENPHTVSVRVAAEKNSALSEALFGGPVVPSLFQFNPLSRFIESVAGDLVVTAAAGVPLIRFNQHDMGVVLPYQTVERVLCEKEPQIDLRRAWRWPFVTLFGRSDRTLVLYAANIYPEHIQTALNDVRYLRLCTGKFFMEKKQLPRMEQKFVIHIELRAGVRAPKDFEKSIQKHITEVLKHINIEYRDASAMVGAKKMTPHIVLHPAGDPTYFKPGLKPRFMAPQKI